MIGHACPLCPLPRDAQRSRVYRAQQNVYHGDLGSLDDCRELAAEVVDSEWWRERFGFCHTPRVTTLRRRRRAGRWPVGGDCRPWEAHIRLLPSCRLPLLLAHELAHLAQPSGTAAHGPEFCLAFLALTERILGRTTAADLRAAFVAERVRIAEAPPGAALEAA